MKGTAYKMKDDGFWHPSEWLEEYAPERFSFAGGEEGGWTVRRVNSFLRAREDDVYRDWYYNANSLSLPCPGCGAEYNETTSARWHRTDCRWTKWVDEQERKGM